ncbi:MAG TPA: hypothetical protein IAC41_08375 [Candidatus Merdenecus merdavium]|nr:hypothetical protein [Candidatus Merdenecus merdavium]
MKNLLVGNGFNIQFDKTNYTAQQIVLRVLENFTRDDFPVHIIVNTPNRMKGFFGRMFLEAREMLKGKYDSFTTCKAEEESLKAFKERYKSEVKTLRITDIGYEDYYLINDLIAHKYGIDNKSQHDIRESMKVVYFYAIYNNGEIELLHNNYSTKLVENLITYDNIFTTNYDLNIEASTGKEVYHIHGQFDKKRDVYEKGSFRNQLPDAPIDKIEVDETFFYLYSNALTTYCGQYKEMQLKQHTLANNAIDKLTNSYKKDKKVHLEVDEWLASDNPLLINIACGVQEKLKNPKLKFPEDYHLDKMQGMEGELDILGLSPWNDFHIFEMIDNSKLRRCNYYYFSEEDNERIKLLLPKLYKENRLTFSCVKEYWDKYDEK